MQKNLQCNKGNGITVNISGEQINIATDNGQIDAKEYEGKIYNITKTIVVEGEKNSRTSKSREDGNQLFCLGMLGIIVITVLYLNYRTDVQLFIVFAAAIIEIATIAVFYGSKNAKVIYGKNIKEMSYFNMIAIWCVPLLIGFVNTSLYTSKIDLENFKKIIEIEGIIKAFFEYYEYMCYALFQTIGMISLAFLLLHIICSDFYIIAVTNIVIGSRGKWFWNKLFKLTHKRGKDWKKHVLVGVVFLVISILCVCGIIPYIINVLNNINEKNFSEIQMGN